VALTAASEAGAEANATLVSSSELSATRRAYQTALCSCAAGLDALARDYEVWESRVSGGQAKIMMQVMHMLIYLSVCLSIGLSIDVCMYLSVYGGK